MLSIINSLPSTSQVEHYFVNIALIVGAAAIVLLAIAVLILLVYEVARLIIERHYDVRRVAVERKAIYLRERDRAAPFVLQDSERERF